MVALVSDSDACKAWRSRDRLHSSLISIFPAAVIGKPVTVTLLDETRITGRLSSCDGLMNLELDSGVIVRNPITDGPNEFTQLDKMTIFGQRIRYITMPKVDNLPEVITKWEAKTSNNDGILTSRPRKVLKENQCTQNNESEVCHSSVNQTAKKLSSVVQSIYSQSGNVAEDSENNAYLDEEDLRNFASIGAEPSGDKKIDLIMAQTLKVIYGDL
ncbi:unnamed protein product [Trichobilharzia szidati]|nr:unnamed protein product [Trichobilharzia szidati]